LLVRVMSCVMAVVFPLSAMWADTGAAMLYSNGSALVNGQKVERTSAVFAGDRVEAPTGSNVALTMPGSTVMAPANTSLVVGDNRVDVLCGSALVATRKGLAVQVSNLTITPAEAEARYEINHSATYLVVAAREGTLRITDGSRAMVLEVGETLTAKGGCASGSLYNARALAPNAPAAAAASHQVESIVVALAVAAASVAAGIVVALVATRDTSPGTP
jgi:hypothetical protein